MRLRLTVQRHGLPPVQVLWSLASAVRPPLLAVGNSISISQFLEQVNEVIPLESEDWGLEDYSVEVRGFECLHFAELNQVLKEDDEVWWVAQLGLLAYKRFEGHAHFFTAYGLYRLRIYAFEKFLDDTKSTLMANTWSTVWHLVALFFDEQIDLP